MKNLFIIGFIIIVSAFLCSFTVSPATVDQPIIENLNTLWGSEFSEGFKDGYCEGWKDVKGQYAICPIAPIAPLPKIGQSRDSYRDGYNTGFKAGMRAARRSR